MAHKPSRREVRNADREIDNLSQGGTGRGDLAARMLAANRKDIDAEPLNMNPDR